MLRGKRSISICISGRNIFGALAGPLETRQWPGEGRIPNRHCPADAAAPCKAEGLLKVTTEPHCPAAPFYIQQEIADILRVHTCVQCTLGDHRKLHFLKVGLQGRGSIFFSSFLFFLFLSQRKFEVKNEMSKKQLKKD